MVEGTAVLALVLARGGSKGLPRKNVLPLDGVPMLGRVVQTACRAKMVSRIVVSTEDDEIAQVAQQYGAEVPFRRPPELATDTAPALDAVRHALGWLENEEGYRPEVVLLLQANSPLVRSRDIDQVVQLLGETGSDVVYSVSEIDHPPFWAQVIDAAGVPDFLLEESRIPDFERRQNVPRVYRPTGTISAMRVDYFWGCADGQPRFNLPKQGQKTRVLVLDPITSLDIDSPLDYLLAQAVLENGLWES